MGPEIPDEDYINPVNKRFAGPFQEGAAKRIAAKKGVSPSPESSSASH
jgi:hypothetical protein